MSYKVNTYQPTPTVIFNPRATLRLQAYNTDILAESLATVAGMKLVKAGSIFCTDGKQLKRSSLLTDAASGTTTLYVTNPWAFSPGDVLKVIGVPGDTPAAELAAITGATGAAVGTIQSIDSTQEYQNSRITLDSAVIGNVINVDILGMVASYVVKTAVLADELIGLANAIRKVTGSSESVRYISVAPQATYLEINVGSAKTIVEFSATIAAGTAGSTAVLTTSTTTGLGRITLTAALAAAFRAGTKIGTLNQIPQAIWDNEWDFGTYPNAIAVEQAITPCYGGQFYLDALPYIDGQVVSRLPQAAFIPAYA